jgi:hypothetical protein
MEKDIIERLMDFDHYGLTPGQRVSLREEAAIEICRLRQENGRYWKALKRVLNASNDPYEEARRGLGDRTP